MAGDSKTRNVCKKRLTPLSQYFTLTTMITLKTLWTTLATEEQNIEQLNHDLAET